MQRYWYSASPGTLARQKWQGRGRRSGRNIATSRASLQIFRIQMKGSQEVGPRAGGRRRTQCVKRPPRAGRRSKKGRNIKVCWRAGRMYTRWQGGGSRVQAPPRGEGVLSSSGVRKSSGRARCSQSKRWLYGSRHWLAHAALSCPGQSGCGAGLGGGGPSTCARPGRSPLIPGGAAAAAPACRAPASRGRGGGSAWRCRARCPRRAAQRRSAASA